MRADGTPAGAREVRQAAILARDLTKVYPNGLRAVDGIDLEVPPGEFFGLLGPNGAGKTTTIGMLTTRVVPTSGRAAIACVDVGAHPARVKQMIGVVPQTNTLDRSISVLENLYYHGRYFGMGRVAARRAAVHLLDRFRLGDRAGTMVATLSGGMAQRLMVARALMHDPAVLFLDEPTVGLDPQSRIALWDLLRDFNREGQTILLTTHYMEEAEQLCDRVAIMDHGRVLAIGSTDSLKRSVDVETVVRIAVDSQDAGGEERLERLAAAAAKLQEVKRADVRGREIRIQTTATNGSLPRLVVLAEAERVSISDVRVEPPTLESVFITLTGRELRE